jgi:hypothetical protein
MMERGR